MCYANSELHYRRMLLICRPVEGLNRMQAWQRTIYLRDLLRELIVRDFKVRYQRSLLGIGWSWLKPLAQLVVFLFLFGTVLPLDIPYYASFLFAGVLAWSWFGNAAAAAATSITANPELVRRPGFPVRLLPVLVVMNEAIHFVLALPILLAVVAWEVGAPAATLAVLPLVMIVQFVFTLSIAYGVAAAHVRFRDTQDAVGIILMVAFYLTPVFYEPTKLHASYALINRFNPMAVVINAYRDVLIARQWPDFAGLFAVLLLSGLLMAVCMWFFNRQSAGFVEEL